MFNIPERNFFPSLRLVERFEDKVPFVLGLNTQIQFAYVLRSDTLKIKPEVGILILEIPVWSHKGVQFAKEISFAWRQIAEFLYLLPKQSLALGQLWVFFHSQAPPWESASVPNSNSVKKGVKESPWVEIWAKGIS